MLRFLATTTLTLLANGAGLLVAAVALPGLQVRPLGFVVSVLFFTAVEVLLGPFVLKMAVKYVPALRGGIALVTTFVGLFLTTLFTDGLTISGASTWILAPFIVWVFVLVAAVLLPMVLFKNILSGVKDRRTPTPPLP